MRFLQKSQNRHTDITRSRKNLSAYVQHRILGAISMQISISAAKPSYTGLRAFVAFAFCLSSTSACPKVNSPNQSKTFAVEREISIPAVSGKPAALTRVPGVGFGVVGGAASAWAAATDANGQFLWKYSVPTDPKVRFLVQSTFHGVAPLASGGILACGELFTKDNQQTAIVVILDNHGKLVEQRTIFPKDDQTVKTSSFLSCKAWGDGFVLTGRWYDDARRQAYYWLVKLDKNGGREWEKLGEELPGFDGVIAADQSLTLVGI